MKTLAKTKNATVKAKRKKLIVDKKPKTPFENKTHGYNLVNSKITKILVILITLSMTLGIVVGAIVAILGK